MPGAVRVPNRSVPIFTQLVELSDEDLHKVLDAFQADPLPLSSVEMRARASNALEDIEDQEYPQNLVSEIFALTSLSLSHNLLPATIALEVAQSAQLQLDETARQRLQGALTNLLESPASRALGKAEDLYTAHENLLHTARIFTDVRPVFNDSGTDVIGTVLVQRLRIDYLTEGYNKSIELALTGDDIDTLRECLDRADRKAATMSRILKESTTPPFNLVDVPEEE